ncbi:MAG: hypothetical protein U0Q12_12820 [Vicinamibacterales bacterium]
MLARTWLMTVMLVASLTMPAAAQGPALTIDGSGFKVGASKRFLVLMSVFAALRYYRANPVATAAQLDVWQGKVDGLRIFPNWWGNYETSPVTYDPNTLMTAAPNGPNVVNHVRLDVMSSLLGLLDAIGARGMVVELAFSHETVAGLSPNDYLIALAEVTSRLRNRAPHVLFDLQNEVSVFTCDINSIAALVSAVKNVDSSRLVTASVEPNGCGAFFATEENASFLFNWSAPNPTNPGLPLQLDVGAYHDERTYGGRPWFQATGYPLAQPPDGRRVERVRAGAAGVVTKPIIFSEPDRWMAGAGPNGIYAPQTTLAAGNFVEAVVRAKLAGAAAWYFHTEAFFDMPAPWRSTYFGTLEETFVNTFRGTLDLYCWAQAPTPGCVNP